MFHILREVIYLVTSNHDEIGFLIEDGSSNFVQKRLRGVRTYMKVRDLGNFEAFEGLR